jgi:predicted DNA-binding transcriptional regulator AlpA
MTLKRRLRPPAAAEHLGMSESWLAKRRMKGDPPRFLKLGDRSIAYDLADLDDYLAASRRISTSEYPLPAARDIPAIVGSDATDGRVPSENIPEPASRHAPPQLQENSGSHLGQGHRRYQKTGKTADSGAAS